jgi:hypothetical protein
MKHAQRVDAHPARARPTSCRPGGGFLGCLVLAAAGWLAAAPADATVDDITVSNCPPAGSLSVTFQIDCSHVTEVATLQVCRPFLENTACKVFPAYRSITAINLEETCPSIKYTIYDRQSWPHRGGEAGGLTLKCAVEYLADYSVKMTSQIGPYDVHELLHVYHSVLGALPSPHVLFGPSMTEATRKIGDVKGYDVRLAHMKEEVRTFEESFARAAARSPAIKCRLAQDQMEATLYLQNSRSVYAFYRKVARSRNPSQADRDARFNRMYNVVSEGRARQFLIDHGCAPF